MITNRNKIDKKRMVVILITAFVALVTSCDDRWEEMNTDPNQVVNLPDGYLFTSAIRGTFLDDLTRIQADFGGQYAHIVTSDVFNREVDKYNDIHSSGDVQEEIFRAVYNGAIRNIREVMTLTGEGKYKNDVRHAQANVIDVVNIAKLTDLFGDVPYVQAALGKTGTYTSAYDAQEDIYTGMMKQLDDALLILSTASASQIYPRNFDPLYYGDLNAWIRFANSMRLRLAMRGRFVDPITFNPIIADCLTKPLIEENKDNAKLENWDSENPILYNPWYNKIIDYNSNRFTILWAELFINTLTTTNDPRLPFFATKNNKGDYLGMPNGLIDIKYAQWSKANTSRFTPEFASKDQPLYIMTASEIWLLRAEAAVFSIGQPADANALYQTGITKAMEQWGIPAIQISNYITTEPTATLTGDNSARQNQISTQLWIAFVPNFVESWHTIKRTGYPVIQQRTVPDYSKGVTNGFMPRRLKYPMTVEKITNGANIQIAIDRMGGSDKIDTRVWWDKN